MTPLAYTRTETARKRARQVCQAQRGKGIALECSKIRCARDGDGSESHLALDPSNDGES